MPAAKEAVPLLLVLLALGALAWGADTAADDAAVLRALRSAMLTLPVATPAAAIPAGCCKAGERTSAFYCSSDILCPMHGWVENPSAEPCTWTGVKCSAEGRVTALKIERAYPVHTSLLLSASFLETVGQLGALQSLLLWLRSEFDGPTVLPASWARLRRLERLLLEGLALSGGLPPEWAAPDALPALRQLAVFGCGIGGGIPASWTRPGAFPALQRLEIARNELRGRLPLRWPSSLPGLRYLDVGDNRLTGTLPRAWASATLEHMVVRDNRLSGTLPGQWADAMPALVGVAVDHNQLRQAACVLAHGSLPASWRRLSRLTHLALMHNRISGSLPGDLGCNASFPSLLRLEASHNRLTGGLPAGCGLAGAGPVGGPCAVAARPSPLEQLYLRNNSLSGTLPPQLPCSFPALAELDAAVNALSGSLPPSWWAENERGNGAWDFLDKLVLSVNRLQGQLPSGFPLRKGRSLRTADLSHNQLTGTLASLPSKPAHEGSYRDPANLAKLSLTDNRLNGTLPDSWAGSAALCGLLLLNLSGNGFTGTLPPSWLADDVWPTLHYIDVARNKLQGPVNVPARGSRSQVALLVWPGNERLCSDRHQAGQPAACLNVSGVHLNALPEMEDASYFEMDLPAGSDEGWTHCAANTGLQLPACRAGATAGGTWLPWALSAVLLAVAAAVAAGLAALRAHMVPAKRPRMDEEGVQLLRSRASSSDGSVPGPPRWEVAELARRMRALQRRAGLQPPGAEGGFALSKPGGELRQAEVLRQLQNNSMRRRQALLGTPAASLADPGQPAVPLQAAIAFGPLKLKLSDLAFVATGHGGGNSASTGGSAASRSGAGSEDHHGSAGLAEIGAGTSSKVFLARLYDTLPVAVKVMLLPQSPMLDEQLQQEVSMLHRCRHPGILQLVGVCCTEGLVFVVTELMQGGSLLSQLANPLLRYHARGRELLRQVAVTLAHLHHRKIVHLDIKCSNVLLDGTLATAKICDLGKSGILQARIITSGGTTSRYSSPEQLAGQCCGTASDCYSLGVLMLEVLTGQAARGRNARSELQLRVPEHCPAHIAALVTACMAHEPWKRPTAQVVAETLQDDAAVEPDPTAVHGQQAILQALGTSAAEEHARLRAVHMQ